MFESHNIELIAGTLSLTVEESDWPMVDLCGFATRNNFKRQFLFVSKVLGKHVPVRPNVIESSYIDLATKISTLTLPEPILFLSLAETATGLGQGVWESVNRISPGASLFLHSTRYRFPLSLAFKFEEAHSHAMNHLVYEPLTSEAMALFDSAKSLVLIDDEISTGRTLREIALKYRTRNPGCEHLVVATLTDWVSPFTWDSLWNDFPCKVKRVSLLRGHFEFRQSGPGPIESLAPPQSLQDSFSAEAVMAMQGPRFGVTTPASLPENWLATCKGLPEGPILVLGTGEFHYIPFLLARALERCGRDIFFQSTTRSPVLRGVDIEEVIAFKDHCGEGIDNFLYNVKPGQYKTVICCYENIGSLPEEHNLSNLLDATILFLNESA
jgi:hypothetical protein